MQNQSYSPSRRTSSPRPNTQRQRSNSFPIVDVLGCSTPEAQLIMAEGRAAVRKRRARRRQNRSVNDEDGRTFNPRHHLQYLSSPKHESKLTHAKSCHARLPSNATDKSTSTIRPRTCESEIQPEVSPKSPLDNYSANLAQFIKAQLRSIPTYQGENAAISPLSPCSCPDFTFPARAASSASEKNSRRQMDAPKIIEIPPVRPPMQSAFSAWSSTDDETDDEAPPLPDDEYDLNASMSKGSNSTSSIFEFYGSNNSSFLLSSTPLEEDEEPNTAKATSFPEQATLPGSILDPNAHGSIPADPSPCLSQSQLTASTVPSFSSSSASVSSSSYFDYKRPLSLTPEIKGRIIAALTPPIPHSKVIPAISPWEGAAIANVHDVLIESQQRVHVDGMSFDMIRDFIPPAGVTTPC